MVEIGPLIPNMGPAASAIYLIGVVVLAVILAAGIATIIINITMLGYKVDLKDRRTGILKRLNGTVELFYKDQGQGSRGRDRWGLVHEEGNPMAYIKFLHGGFTFPLPQTKDIFPGRHLKLMVTGYKEVTPLVLNKDAMELEASLDYDVVGHVRQRLKAVADTFRRPSALEKYGAYITMVGGFILIAGVLLILTNMLIDQIASTQAGTEATARYQAELLYNMSKQCAPLNPPPG